MDCRGLGRGSTASATLGGVTDGLHGSLSGLMSVTSPESKRQHWGRLSRARSLLVRCGGHALARRRWTGARRCRRGRCRRAPDGLGGCRGCALARRRWAGGDSSCAVSVWGETSDVAGEGDGSWAGLDDCCSGAAATLSLVEAGLAGASACTAPDLSVPWDVAGLSLVEAGLAGVSACTDP